jgi:Immunoglobulin domain/Lamin Tail Domain
MKTKLTTLASLIALCFAPVAAQATILLQDNFSYPDGLLPTNATQQLGAWLKYSGNGSGVPVSGGQLYLGQTFSDDVTSPLTNAPYTATTGTNVLYASFTVNLQAVPTGNGGFYFAYFKDTGTGSTFRGRVFALTNGVANAAANNTFRLGIANGASSAAVTNTTDLSLGTTYTVVTRLVLPSGVSGNPTNLASTLWVTSAPGSLNEASPSITATDATTALTLSNYAFRQPGSATSVSAGAATLALDNLIIGTSFADVVPGSASAPAVLIQPQDTNNLVGTTILFSTLAVGDPPLSYQWFSNNPTGPILYGTNATLGLTNITVSQTAGYWAAITNLAGSNYTRTAMLTVSTIPVPPTITNQPASTSVTLGNPATFTVVAGGDPTPAYQWYFVTNSITNILSGQTSPTLTIPAAKYSDQGNYFVTITNSTAPYTTNSALATLTVNAPPLNNIAYLRSTVDPTTYAPTNTTSLFRARGVVTTYCDMTTSGNSEFFIQDSTAGIAVFWSGAAGSTNLPPAGALVEVIAPLANFDGLLELEPIFTNSLHSVTVISTGNPLPAPQPLPFDPDTQNNPAIMDMLEGSYFVATNVILDASSPIFLTVSAGEQITDPFSETFTMYINAYTDIPGQPKPSGPVTIYGVLGQYVNTSPYNSGYQFIPTRYEDIVPAVRFTNILQNLTRAGDLPTNTFTESVLRPGESLTMNVVATDPAGGTVTIQPVLDGLSPNAVWANTASASGAVVTNVFSFQPTQGDSGSNYAVTLSVTTSSYGTWSNIWNVYVPTNYEQQIYISEFLANPTTNTALPFFNPLNRAIPSTNSSVQDEYIEIANLSGTNVDLLNWTVSDAMQTRHQWANGASYGEVLGSSNAIVVYGGPLDGYTPRLPVLSFPASGGSAGLALKSTGTGVIRLRNGSGYLVDRVVYYGSSLSTNGSLSRFPTVNDGFVPQAYISTHLVTPGKQYDGGAWNQPTKVPAAVTGIVVTKGNPFTLSFTANTGLATTLWQANNVGDPFQVIFGQQFASPASAFYITNPPPLQQFYFITTQ